LWTFSREILNPRLIGPVMNTRAISLALAAIALTSLAPFSPCAAQRATPAEVARWNQEARRVTIIRDDWGIAHVYGKSDADAVFGMIYAQAEDDFNRVETNYINAMGRLSEAEGEPQVYRDLRMKLFVNTDTLKAEYAASPPWLRAMMNSFADALNFYLYRHPEVKPRVITHFEPWMALAFTEGSIGGDIETVSLKGLEGFYGHHQAVADADLHRHEFPKEPSGSNGFAIAPSNTLAHHALLWINPHTSFFFRSELQMVSDQGLDAYGAVTWGQFFIYQGFNDRAGWMHTSSGVDAVDEYAETIVKRPDGKLYYRYGRAELPVTVRTITVPYRTATGMARRVFTAYYTQHGPVVREAGGKWITVRMMHRPIQALMQSFLRTKARNYAEYRKTMSLHANSSNNTVFADANGDIAYFQANFIPRRDTSFDWTRPVDGSNPATDWHGVLSTDKAPHLLNPPNGWLFNTNDAPWWAAGPYSPKKQDFPSYVDRGGENARGVHARMVLQNRKDFTPDRVIAAAFDSYLTEFAVLRPALLRAWDATPASDPLRVKLAAQIAALRAWNLRWSVSSVPTSLAVFWGTDLMRRARPEAQRAGMSFEDYVTTRAPASELLGALAAASDSLTADFGTWRTPWGHINRFQRLTGAIVQPFNDAKPSIPVGFTSSIWGSLASFGARPYPGTKKWYGTSGNSFLAIVQFGDSVRAKAITAGGESGHPSSPHFDDQAVRYATGNLRDVYYYRSQLRGHTEREYHPGG